MKRKLWRAALACVLKGHEIEREREREKPSKFQNLSHTLRVKKKIKCKLIFFLNSEI